MDAIENPFISFIKSTLANGDHAFIEDFVANGPVPGGKDAANRYLLAVALNDISAERFAEMTSTSIPVAQHLQTWLEAGMRA